MGFLAMRQKLIRRNAPLRSPHKAEKATADNKHYMRGEASFSKGGPSSFYGGIYKKDIGGGYNILRVYGVQLQRTTAEQSISFSDMSALLLPPSNVKKSFYQWPSCGCGVCVYSLKKTIMREKVFKKGEKSKAEGERQQ